MTGRNVQKDQFVSPLLLITSGNLNRITRVLEIQKIHSLNDTPRVHIKTWNNSPGEHRCRTCVSW